MEDDEDLDGSKEFTRISTDEEEGSTEGEDQGSREVGVGYDSKDNEGDEFQQARGSVGSPGVPGRPILQLPGRYEKGIRE